MYNNIWSYIFIYWWQILCRIRNRYTFYIFIISIIFTVNMKFQNISIVFSFFTYIINFYIHLFCEFVRYRIFVNTIIK